MPELSDPAPNAAASKTGTASIYAKLKEMEGIFEHAYEELRGAEKAIRDEREAYSR